MTQTYSQGLIDAERRSVPRSAQGEIIPVPECEWSNELDTSLFTHPVYLRAHGKNEVLSLRVPGLPGSGRALFSRTRQQLVYLNRLAVLSSTEIDAMAEAAFEQSNASFIVLRDVQLRQDGSTIGRPHRGFHYQANWDRAIGPDEKYLSSRQASSMRRKTRKFAEHVGAKADFGFRRTIASDIDVIGDLNRTKIERRGSIYQMSRRKREILKEVAGQIGYTATIHAEGRLIAGTIMCGAMPNVYCMILGYDLEFAKFSQGLHVNDQALAKLAELGFTHVNFLWGDSRWKADLGAERRPLTTFIICRNRRAYLDPALLRAVLPHAKIQLKRRIKAAITRSSR